MHCVHVTAQICCGRLSQRSRPARSVMNIKLTLRLWWWIAWCCTKQTAWLRASVSFRSSAPCHFNRAVPEAAQWRGCRVHEAWTDGWERISQELFEGEILFKEEISSQGPPSKLNIQWLIFLGGDRRGIVSSWACGALSVIPTDHLALVSYNVKISFETKKGGGRMGGSGNKVEGVAFVLLCLWGRFVIWPSTQSMSLCDRWTGSGATISPLMDSMNQHSRFKDY